MISLRFPIIAEAMPVFRPTPTGRRALSTPSEKYHMRLQEYAYSQIPPDHIIPFKPAKLAFEFRMQARNITKDKQILLDHIAADMIYADASSNFSTVAVSHFLFAMTGILIYDRGQISELKISKTAGKKDCVFLSCEYIDTQKAILNRKIYDEYLKGKNHAAVSPT